MYYTLHTARQKDRVGILRILTILSSCKEDRAYEDPFLHSLIALLIPMADEFANEDFCTGLFDGFLFAGLARDNVTKHILKLLWYVYGKLPTPRLKMLMKAIEPTAQHHEFVHKLYDSLKERTGAAITEQSTEPMDFDSPLKVPILF